jgi:cytidylate kinase
VTEIRKEMVKKQRLLGKKKGAVMEGRDIGTVVFPKADFKFYLEANPEIRAQRRYKEIMLAGRQITLHEVHEDLKRRDHTDYSRKEGPLKQAKDAFLIETTALTIRQVVDTILTTVRSKSISGTKLKRQRAYA